MFIQRLSLVSAFVLASWACSGGRGAPGTGGSGGSGGTGGSSGIGGAAGRGGENGATAGGGGGQPGKVGGADGRLDEGGPPLTSAAGFEAHGTITATLGADNITPAPTADVPSSQDFLLHVDPTAGSLVVSSPGRTSQAGVSTADRVHFAATGSLSFELPPTNSLCSVTVTYSSFTFTVHGETVSGSAEGTALVIAGDVGYSYRAQLTFAGSADTHGPTMNLPATAVDPVRPPSFTPSEPLPSTATATLASDADLIALDVRPGMSQAVTSFGVHTDRALRYATRYQLAVTPWQDLLGNPGTPPAAFTTSAAPDLVAEDGFEGAATTVGGARIVDATVLPPLTGKRSAVVTSSSTSPSIGFSSPRLTVRLPVQPGDTVVRVNLRPWASYQATVATSNLSFLVAVPGGALVSQNMVRSIALGTMIMSGSSPVWMGETLAMELALPSGASAEIVVDISTRDPPSCGLLPPAPSYLVDDLRVE